MGYVPFSLVLLFSPSPGNGFLSVSSPDRIVFGAKDSANGHSLFVLRYGLFVFAAQGAEVHHLCVSVPECRSRCNLYQNLE